LSQPFLLKEPDGILDLVHVGVVVIPGAKLLFPTDKHPVRLKLGSKLALFFGLVP